MGATLYVSGVPCKDCALRIMQSGIRRLVYLNEGMHVGSTPDEFWEKYGFGQDRLERVPMTTPEVFENETQESLTAQ
jgi:deoxycytidylate deaminase